MEINVKLDSPTVMPRRAHATDAGADLVTVESYNLRPGEKKLFDTGVAMAIPEGFVGLVFNRSSQGKNGIQIPNSVGVIDSGYRGNIKVLLENKSSFVYEISSGETKIAQLVIVPIVLPFLKIVDSLEDTARGTGGFGSTGQ